MGKALKKILDHKKVTEWGTQGNATVEELEKSLREEREVTARLLREIEQLREKLAKMEQRGGSSQVQGSVHNAENGSEISETDNGKWAKRNSDALKCGSYAHSAPSGKVQKTAISGEAFEEEAVLNFKVKYVTKDQETKQNLEDAIKKNPMLGRLDLRQIRDIVNSMELRNVKLGDKIIDEGTEGNELYVSADGSFDVTADGKPVNSFGSWVVFGELALLYGCQRTASVSLASCSDNTKEASIWYTDRRTFQMIMMKTGILRQQQNLSFLRNISFFTHLKDKEVELLRLVDALTEERYLPGEYVFRQGAIGETFYIVQEGELNVMQQQAGGTQSLPKVIATLREGETFGERALQGDDVRTAGVVAISETVLLAIGRNTFERTLSLASADSGRPPVPLTNIYDDGLQQDGLPAVFARKVSIDGEFDGFDINSFKKIGRLGAGGFGRVDLVQIKGETTRSFALKCLSKKHIVQRKQQAHVFTERDIQKSLRHPFMARLYATFRDPCYLYMLMEPCLGGEMWCVLRQCGRLTEKEAIFIVACIVEALAYLHRRHIVFRDLKPENMMLDARGYCKLIDFGFAKRLNAPAYKTWTFCGTPEYMAPEVILNKGHTFTADLWSLGILIFELLSGWPPFIASDHMATYNKVLAGFEKTARFPADQFPESAQDLVLKLCKVKPPHRLGAELCGNGVAAIRTHKWFSTFNWVGLREQSIDPLIVPQLSGPTDLTNFDQTIKKEPKQVKPDETGWDEGF